MGDTRSSAEVERGVAQRPVRRARGGELCGAAESDDVVIEEPLEIRIAGDLLATTMRTPGQDVHLVVGFLYSEGIVRSLADVGTVAHCGRPDEEGFGNVVDLIPAAGVVIDLERIAAARRDMVGTSCGVCGRRSVEDLLARVPRREVDAHLSLSVLMGSTGALEKAQPNFARTGGLHAAVALGPDGTLVGTAEDAGRHNAVDKLVGALLYRQWNAAEASGEGGSGRDWPPILAVSGRTSFEIVQKAAMAGFVAIASVSAPTSLAVDLAEASGITLAGFVRGGRANIYTHPERVF